MGGRRLARAVRRLATRTVSGKKRGKISYVKVYAAIALERRWGTGGHTFEHPDVLHLGWTDDGSRRGDRGS